MAKVAIVTGAGTGVGHAAALALMKAGYSVALAGRRQEPLEAVAKEGGGNALAVPTDVTRSGRRSARCSPRRRRSSAGSTCCSTTPASGAPPVPFEELPVEKWKDVVDTNLTGAVRLHPGSVQDHEGPEPARRPHHQQRLDLGAHAAAALGALYLDQARHHRADQVDGARRARVRHRLRRRSTSATPRRR